MSYISKVLLGGELDGQVLARAEHATLMVVDQPLRQYSSFLLRLLAATVVATGGIAADSATTVIGAMLIAPLMSPMLGCALATAQGRPACALRALGITVGGMVLVVASSALITALIPVAADMNTNTQVLSRISPRLVDLIIALAASFMASLASMRDDIPDAVPGVAISASIVPPLCVVGAALFEGAWDAAFGAFLLFITNFFAIQVMGSVVYLCMGLGARRFSSVTEQVRNIWYAFVALAAVIIAGLLFGTSMGIVQNAEHERLVQDVTSDWLDGDDYRVTELAIDDGELYVQISGSGKAPSVEALNTQLKQAGVELDGISLSVVEEHRVSNTHADGAV